MLHGRVVRPPAVGAKLVSVDESSIRGIPDVRVVRIESFLGVVSKDEWAVVRAAREIKAQWSDWQGLPGSEGFEDFLRQAPTQSDKTLADKGDVNAALSTARKQLTATYYWPFQSHASLGPSCAIADVKESGTTVWSSSQNPYGLRANLAKVFGIPQEKTRVVYLDGSGSYGTNGADDAAADALLLSRAAGSPVRVQWMRQDEHGWDPKGPAQLHQLRGAVGDALREHPRLGNADVAAGYPQGNRALAGPESAAYYPIARSGCWPDDAESRPALPGFQSARDLPSPERHAVAAFESARAPGKLANVFAIESD